MKIFRISSLETKTVKWECPETGIYILAHFTEGDTNGYELYHADDSFVDIFDNFWHARNWAKKHMDRDCKIPTYGVRVDKDIENKTRINSDFH